MTQYLMSVYHSEREAPLSPEEMQQSFADTDVFNHKLMDAGVWVFAGGLHPVETATVVDGRGAETLLTDGPFAESKEHLGGFWIIEAPDLDAALEWARQGSIACRNPVEVRPFQSEPGA
jgi:hypothetical protein